MDDRTERLLDKAEKALDLNNTEQADHYRILAGTVMYMRRKEARDMERLYSLDTSPAQGQPVSAETEEGERG